MTRSGERGSAVLIVMLVIGSLIAVAAALTTLHNKQSQASEVTQKSAAARYCAEAGIAAAQSTVVANAASWNASLGTGVEPAWLSVVDHDLDGNGTPDFTIELRDDDDEAVNDLSHDTNHAVFLVSTCIAHPENRSQVSVLVTDTGVRRLWLQTE